MSCFKNRRQAGFLKTGSGVYKLLLAPMLWALGAGVLAGPGTGSARAEDPEVIKFSTLAPEGSSWMKEMRRLSRDVEQATEGAVTFRFYPGGVSGDEKDVIRKMRIGQLHGAGFTGVGLGEILSEVRVLDLPFLFETDRQVRHVYQKMHTYFVERFEKNGYVLLGWVPVGWVHFFSKQHIRTVQDLKQSKPWLWQGDPLVREAYHALNINPIPLSITDVLLSLQTGMIDTVYASPQGALALQWFTKTQTMSQVRMAYATGGVLLTQRKFSRLSSEHQKALKKLGAQHLDRLVKTIQEENNRSIEVMLRNGVELSQLPPQEDLEAFHQAGAIARKNLVGKLYSQNLLDTVLGYLKEVK